ncbi:LysM peptidoglycan-binding domain-containing protein [Aurantibacter crassamenti]|uniref:LysM peptidoglycan-binding domain-containing protein n=1 Tax=Aurantibacter crassamenti TaxID=1837375 RepID=UPI00193A4DBC|nr:LysM peptidoglycan-binding domain-containing protein [Aurantibacter crassamenti]MBM1107925.1 LysM peptidoglycan-binding domain-containing protein [Aurantibacter crassamenti]
MNQVLKNILVLFIIVLSGCKSTAQKFTTHAVKKGETLEGIAKQYSVSTDNILIYNKEIKKGQALRTNTILVIPASSASGVSTKPVVVSDENSSVKSKVEPPKPIGFTSHKVRRKETLYGIAKRYNITEEDVKRYNRDLYSAPLKKNMELRIPKYKRVREDDINAADYITYKVAPKETRWSIAHKHSITIDSLLVLNPELSKTSDYLRMGQELKLPKIPGSTIEDQETQIYKSYTVPPKMNFYRLEQEFNVKSDEIVRLNPEITEKGGLKEGMVIRIPEQKLDAGEVNTDNFNFYEVKPKQTEFSLTRKLGISYKDLLALNPDLSEGLKAGMILKLPKDQMGDFEVRNALVLDKLNLVDSINLAIRPKVMFMLPFRINKLDLSDKAEIDRQLDKPSLLKYSLGFYSGALVAMDSIAKLGVSIDVKTFDNQLDLSKTKEILMRENLSDYNAIVGPFDLASVREVAVRAADKRVPVITPIRPNKDVSLKNVFFSYTADPLLRKKMISYIKEIYTDENIVVIADSTHVVVRDSLKLNFPEAKIAEVIEEEKNIGVDIEKLKLLLSKEKENWIFVESDNFKLVTSVTSILNSLQNSLLDPENDKEKIKLRLFTTFKERAFESEVISSVHLSNLNFTYPSVFREPANNSFEKAYRKRFSGEPDRYAVRGFDTTFDLLLKLAYKNDLFNISQLVGETEYTGNKFSYEKDFASGYFNQASYIMSYEDLRLKELKTIKP